ncbi:MAG: biotin--[acetyl-CoA-carboxylase] ligase [Candidatus Fervidibacter sp.]|uniref:biotin--[acetyl-CoA-carboxylase] ligase n=1 Tax=Candidatus Fervidibacter sp. TaxID=3100871 RepID=UPI004049E027
MEWVEKAVNVTRWLGKDYKFFAQTTSTQDEARILVKAGAKSGVLVVADEQTKGRGRFGRSWFSPPKSNIYFTTALQLPPTHPQLTTLPLLVGVAVAEAIRKMGINVFVKWANDIVFDGKKLAGILTESEGNWVFIGVGVNVNLTENDLPNDLKGTATSMRIVTGKTLERSDVLAAILVSLERWWEVWAKGNLSEFWSTWERFDALKGKQVFVAMPDGTKLEGVADGVSEDGSLKLKLQDESTLNLAAGEVRVR